jgi:hypothetical protein
MTDPRWRDDLDDVDIDPDEAVGAETGADRNRDAGTDLDTEGIPADDRTSGLGQVPDPEVPAAPTDEPVGSAAYGTTEWEQRTGESLDAKFAREEPDEPAVPPADSTGPAEEAAVHVERVPPTAPDGPPPPDEVRPDDELLPPPDASRPDEPVEPGERPSSDELGPSDEVPPGKRDH